MKPTFSEMYSNELTLKCPGCGGEYLHHNEVEVFNRHKEDDETGIHVRATVDCILQIDTAQLGNPSSRRDGVIIHLWCENCDHDTQLLIYQHKGCTQLEVT